MYNYLGGTWTPPSNCLSLTTTPPSGTTNNGNVMGEWYLDNASTCCGHAATYLYDNVNRLTSAVATGNWTYNLSFIYTQDGSTGCAIR